MVTLEQIRRICPRSPAGLLERFVKPLNEEFQACAIETVERHAAFIGQYAFETDGFTKLDERLHYTSVERVRSIFSKHFIQLSDDDVRGFMESPEMFASRIYANRNGNGPESSGDGWKYRGRGLCHLTFRGNYERCGSALELDLVEQPDLLLDPVYAVRAGGWFWRSVNGNRLAYTSLHDVELLTRYINGGINGLKQRTELFELALKVLREAS